MWQRDAVAKQAHLESKVNDLNELVERLEQNISSTQMVLKLREASLKKHGIDKDDVDRELLELRKIVSVPPEVVKLRMELARVTEGLERAEAEASSSNTKGEYARMVEELNCMRAVNVEQSELARPLEQKLWFDKEKIALLENLREVESKVELAELRAVDAEANQFRAENAKSEAERAYIESQKITDDAVKEKVRVESTLRGKQTSHGGDVCTIRGGDEEERRDGNGVSNVKRSEPNNARPDVGEGQGAGRVQREVASLGSGSGEIEIGFERLREQFTERFREAK